MMQLGMVVLTADTAKRSFQLDISNNNPQMDEMIRVLEDLCSKRGYVLSSDYGAVACTLSASSEELVRPGAFIELTDHVNTFLVSECNFHPLPPVQAGDQRYSIKYWTGGGMKVATDNESEPDIFRVKIEVGPHVSVGDADVRLEVGHPEINKILLVGQINKDFYEIHGIDRHNFHTSPDGRVYVWEFWFNDDEKWLQMTTDRRRNFANRLHAQVVGCTEHLKLELQTVSMAFGSGEKDDE